MVRLDVRWPRHASLYLGSSELCCSVTSHRTIRPLSARAHGLYSGCILIWLGSRGWILWQNRRCDGAIPCTHFHHSYLRIVHRAFLLCNHLVALDDFPFPCCIGHRWRVGGWRFHAFRNMACKVAALDGCGATERCEFRSGSCNHVWTCPHHSS